jgi:hypothetical protein
MHDACQILIKLEFSQQVFKRYQISNFMKMHPVGVELFHADRQTDRQMDRYDEEPKNHEE